MLTKNKIHIAIPAIAEKDYLPACIASFQKQSFQNFTIYICINQAKEYWEKKKDICINNQESLAYLKNLQDDKIIYYDLSSPEKALNEKISHVGTMRRFLMDKINEVADDDDIIISFDADSVCPENYLEEIIKTFNNSKAVALSVPYYHPLTENDSLNRHILRYEIYMRAYAINMWRIKSPYAFSALGSAIALPVKSYRIINGITPKKSGEDFYFLQKLVKYGKISHWANTCVYPAARYSDRVFFGTGPALIKGKNKDWLSYPIYKKAWFEEIAETYTAFSGLFKKNIPTPMDDFLNKQFAGKNIWRDLRKNFIKEKDFVRSCHEKIDGLRILQFLKSKYEEKLALHKNNEEHLIDLLGDYGEDIEIDFEKSNTAFLQKTRDTLQEIENDYRKKDII
jgi:glycosyltransferase involved in cell wall biosynthesis